MPRLIYFLFTVSCLLVAVCCLLFAAPIHANESALAVSPAITEVITRPGEPVVKEVQVTNTTSFPLPIHAQAAKFLANEIKVQDGDATFDSSSWFVLDPGDFILQPHETKSVRLTITAPPKAEPGGHYATVFFNPLIPESVLAQGSSTSLARIGVLAFLVVPGNIHEQLTLNAIEVPKLLSSPPLVVQAKLTNPGSIHLIPTVTLNLTNIWGQTVEGVRGELVTILPGTTRTLTLTSSKPHLFGQYQVSVTLQYGTTSPPLVSPPETVWIIPWPPLAILLILLTILYRLFIVNGRRVVLAWRVLRGQEIAYDTPQNNAKNQKMPAPKPKRRPSSSRRSHPPLSRP